MGFKNYIAAFFVLLFLGKMVSIDAKLLGIIYSASEVTLVNNMCPKQQLDNDSPDEFAQADLESHFEFDYLCQVAFDFKPDEEVNTVTHNNFKKHSYRAPGIFSISRDKFYPPPKV
ncbi:hypothetical protein [Salinimicrobium sediminilitoris]|uniref:hypothetical protein n=1 Tax=Salinimicrobium sediminilitoris TaxID=2876715 RepID=UPI001E5B8F62|nr:hypothetical protein [Salinimicrobium sediminilitoris]MCC8361308.1 hypothetical protein [Salinimicrobium sediminilitoris]